MGVPRRAAHGDPSGASRAAQRRRGSVKASCPSFSMAAQRRHGERAVERVGSARRPTRTRSGADATGTIYSRFVWCDAYDFVEARSGFGAAETLEPSALVAKSRARPVKVALLTSSGATA